MKLKKIDEALMLWLSEVEINALDLPLPSVKNAAPVLLDNIWITEAAPLTAEIAENVIQFKRKQSFVPVFVPNAVWPSLDKDAISGLSGVVSKFNANIAAIELLRKLEEESRNPTVSERAVLNCYTGWGGIPQAFNENQKDEAWVSRAKQLTGLLSAKEHASAEASTPNAHYTAPEVIEAMWGMVQRLGFNGGRILEPSVGTGLFLGAMPKVLVEKSTITAIELDCISARIAKSLYGNFGVKVLQSGFEAAKLPEDFYDLAISNVPFGSYKVPEQRNVPYADFLIHDYFFAKAMEVVRPGGLVAFITSSGTLDKVSSSVREYLASKAELMAAVRLPNTAFSKIANASVTTDILILRKTQAGTTTASVVNSGWMNVGSVPKTSVIHGGGKEHWHNEAIICNEYFVKNPQFVIGQLSLISNGYAKATGCTFEGNLENALAEKTVLLPKGIYTDAQKKEGKQNTVFLLPYAVASGRPGFLMVDGQVCETSDGIEALQYKAPQKTLERIAGMCAVRDAARKVIKCQVETDDDTILSRYQLSLNMIYDNFVAAKHGFIHTKANQSAFKADPDTPLLMSLERWDAETQTAEKADIFNQRTVGRFKPVERCETAEDALLACLAERGGLDEDRIGELMSKQGCDVMQELEGKGLVYLDPQSGMWESSDSYLSGNVRKKLAVAQLSGDRYAHNAQALEAVIGQFAGFDVSCGTFLNSFSLNLIGNAEYQCGLAETAPGCIRVLENALNSVDQEFLEQQNILFMTEKRLIDIGNELSKPFDKADRFELLKQRQKEIEVELDLNKDEKAAVDETEEVV